MLQWLHGKEETPGKHGGRSPQRLEATSFLCIYMYLRLFVCLFIHRPNGCSQSGNGSPLTGFEVDISTSATLSGRSLTHNSGTTFRSWVSIGLTSVVSAIPAGENADQYFDHCSFVVVPPSGPRRTHRFPVATLFSDWFACSGCRTCLFHCYLDQKQACSRSSPFDSLIPGYFHSGNLKSHGSSLLAVKCANIQFSLSFVVHIAAIGCCAEIICS